MYFIFHHFEVCGGHLLLYDMLLLTAEHCVLRKRKGCCQLSVTFFSYDRTSYAFHTAVLISHMFVIEYLKYLDFTWGSQHVVNIPCITEKKKQKFPGWVWVKRYEKRSSILDCLQLHRSKWQMLDKRPLV